MADHIPFITGEDGVDLVRRIYHDSDVVRVPLEKAARFLQRFQASPKIWLDAGVDGMDDLEGRRDQTDTRWFQFMARFPNFDKVGASDYQKKPVKSEVEKFVREVLDECNVHRPAWITVPQVPLVQDSDRNKINRVLAAAAGNWKTLSGFMGKLILPLIFTHQSQTNSKTARNPKVTQAERCYHDSQADGFWAVDKSLSDESGSSTLRQKRFPGLIDLHEELNMRITSKIRIAGPYWGLNLVLWARGLVDYPAIGIGSGYQYFLTGGQSRPPTAKVALPSLRRRVIVGPQLKSWLDASLSKLGSSHPVHAELNEIKKRYTALSATDQAREQVAQFYKRWCDMISTAPKAGRSMALFQDLSAAYALGKSLPDLHTAGTDRRPEAVAEPLMLSCL